MSGFSQHVVTTPPSGSVVTLAEAQEHCSAPDDPSVAKYLAAAIRHVQTRQGIKLLNQTVQLTRNCLPRCMALPLGPVTDVVIEYLDSSGTKQTMPKSIYALVAARTLAARVELLPGQSWPALLPHPEAVTFTLSVGYGTTPEEMPEDLRHAILLLTADWYLNREATMAERGVTPTVMPIAVDGLLADYKVFA